MKKIVQIFQEDNGQFSSMRVMSFIALMIASILSFRGITYDILMIWLIAAFAPKAIQKFAERKKP